MFSIIVIAVVIGVLVMVGDTFIDSVATNINDSNTFSDQGKDILNEANANYENLWDNMFMFLFIGLWLVLLVAMFFIQEHPVMAVFTIIIVVLFLILAPILSNIFASVAGTAEMQPEQFPKMKFILDHLLVFAIAMGLSGMLVLYAKGRLG